MSNTVSLRRFIAVPAVIALSLSGVMLLAAPAVAADDTLVVLTPVDQQAYDSHDIEVSGTGTPGGLVTVGSPYAAPNPVEVEPDGTWDTDIDYPIDAFSNQGITISQTVGGEPAGARTIGFSLPLPVFATIDQPDGTVFPGRTVVFTGTAVAGTIIEAGTADDPSLSGILVEPGAEEFELPVSFPFGPAEQLTVIFTVSISGLPGESLTRTVQLLASPSAPVITSPSAGSTVPAGVVTFTGTATPGEAVEVETAPNDYGHDNFYRSAPAITAADGTWTTQVTVGETGSFIAFATIVSSDGAERLSESTSVVFTVDAVVTEPAAPAKPGTPASPVLAATGATTDLLLPAALLLLLGAALVVVRRRRSTAAE